MNQGSVTITTGTGGSAPEGHDEKMVQRYEAGQAAAAAGLSAVPPNAPAAPTDAPAGAPGTHPAAPAAPAGAPPVAPEGEQGFIDTLLKNANLTRDGLAAEYGEGGLKPESYEALAKQGIDKATVDQYFAGLEAAGKAQTAEYEQAVIKETVGSPEKYQEVVGWAAQNLSDQEVQAFNDAVSSGNQALARLAVSGLQARFAAATPPEPKLLTEGVQSVTSAVGFESWAQVKTEMAKREYKTDPAFRAAVQRRLAVSNI